MSDPEKNLFKIMDGIINQLNKTKKLFIIMILTVMILPPITFLVTSAIFDPPFEQGQKMDRSNKPFFSFRHIPLLISLVWLGVGIRQWLVLTKWTKKYSKYKEEQEKIDKQIADDDEEKPTN